MVECRPPTSSVNASEPSNLCRRAGCGRGFQVAGLAGAGRVEPHHRLRTALNERDDPPTLHRGRQSGGSRACCRRRRSGPGPAAARRADPRSGATQDLPGARPHGRRARSDVPALLEHGPVGRRRRARHAELHHARQAHRGRGAREDRRSGVRRPRPDDAGLQDQRAARRPHDGAHRRERSRRHATPSPSRPTAWW